MSQSLQPFNQTSVAKCRWSCVKNKKNQRKKGGKERKKKQSTNRLISKNILKIDSFFSFLPTRTTHDLRHLATLQSDKLPELHPR